MYKRLLRIVLPLSACMAAVTASENLQQVFANPQDSVDIQGSDKPSLSDLLTVSRDASIFYGYLRESAYLVERLANPLQTTTIFAPRDVAIMNLARKPHQGPADNTIDSGVSTEDAEKENAAYLQEWTRRHIVAGTDVEVQAGQVYESLAGKEKTISFSTLDDSTGSQDWQKVLAMPGSARILDRKEGKDGVLYILDATLQDVE